MKQEIPGRKYLGDIIHPSTLPDATKSELIGQVRGFQRHRYRVALEFISDLIAEKKVHKILDVGGFHDNGVLTILLPDGVRPFSVNILKEYHGRPGHVTFDGQRLPFLDGSFPAVLSVDVLEHVTKESRFGLVKEMVRVARNRVIVSAPHGSAENIRREEKFLAGLSASNLPPKRSFVEHNQRGLPTIDELEEIGNNIGLPFRLEMATNADIDFAGLNDQVYAMLEYCTNPRKRIAKARRIAARTEQLLSEHHPHSWEEAYRAVLIIDKPTISV